MNELMQDIPRWLDAMLPVLAVLLIVLVVVFVAASMLIPFTALIWWAGWIKPSHTSRDPGGNPRAAQAVCIEGPFLVYLSGIGDISGDYSTRYEDEFLDALAARIRGLAIITDVFAFSFTNQSMTSQRLLGWFWRWVNAERLRKGPLKATGKLIEMRNILHVGVSADRRYGPIYNYGTAEMIVQGLLRKGYRMGSGTPITLLGYSGGGQIALASAGYLKATLQAPVQVISLAGIMNAHPAIDHIDRLYHIYGSKDWHQRVGVLIFPSRWPFFVQSRWNRALTAGKIEIIRTGPMLHSGRGSYLDATKKLDNGQSYMDYTADLVAAFVQQLAPVEKMSG